MTFLELGLALREARIAQGLSIDDIADRLKLTSSLVKRLEEGDIASLPHAVYTRGFIRGYAAIVHMDIEEYQQVIDETYPLNVPNEYGEKIVLVPSARRRSNKHFLLLACIVFGGVLFGAYWKFSQSNEIVVPVINGPAVEQNITPSMQAPLYSSTNNEQGSQANSGNFLEKSSDSKALTVEELTARELAKGQGLHNAQSSSDTHLADTATQDVSATEKSQVVSQLDEKLNAQSDVQADTKPAASESKKAASAITSSKHEIEITAQEDCWMRVVPDGGKATQMVLKKGETMTYQFAKNIEMRFGNGGGVSLSYDGKAMPAPGKRGKPITVVYPLQD